MKYVFCRMFPVLWVFLFFATPVLAADRDEVTLSYDDGDGERWLGAGNVDSLEDIMFFMEHPATVLRFRMQFAIAGPVEIHIWGDGGGNDPDRSNDLIEPIIYEVPQKEKWLEFDISDLGVELPALKYVHLGLIRLPHGSGLLIDEDSDPSYSFVYPEDDPTVKYLIGETGNFMVRLDVNYHDIATDFLFEEIADIASISRVAWGDYDNDGDDDMLVSAATLYRNNGDGSFTDVSEAAGIVGIPGYGMWADYDNDGHLDYYAFSRGLDMEGRDRLVHNEGDGSFAAVEDLEMRPWDLYPTEAVGWADYDNDGWVDLYVANYELELSQCTPDILWKNLREGKFRNVNAEAGIQAQQKYCGRGVAWGDYNNDGLIDLYVANYRLDPNQFYENQGDGSFKEIAFAKKVVGNMAQGAYGHSIGAVWGDVDNDKDLDLFIGNLAHPRFIEFSDKSMFYENSGPPDYKFTDRREASGITYTETHSDPLLFDYDNDGLLDLALTAIYTDFSSFLYHNEGDWAFTDLSYVTGLHVLNGWGITAVDYDRDGDLDVSTRKFFRNNTIVANEDQKAGRPALVNHWLQVKLKGRKSNTAGIGCRITVEAGGRSQIREVEGGKGTGVQSSLVQHFGLGEAVSATVRVLWVDGVEQVMQNVEADQRIVMEEENVPDCLNQLGECTSETTLHVCRDWQEVDEDCPEGWLCEDRFCYDPNAVDGDGDGELDDEENPDGDGDVEEEVLTWDTPMFGDCCVERPSPGCGLSDITDCVCPLKVDCCTRFWVQECVDLALAECALVCDPDEEEPPVDGDERPVVDGDEALTDGDATSAEEGGGCRNAGQAHAWAWMLMMLLLSGLVPYGRKVSEAGGRGNLQ